jgi:hypothetical protein
MDRSRLSAFRWGELPVKLRIPGWFKVGLATIGGASAIIGVLIDILVGRPDSKTLKIWDLYSPILARSVPAWLVPIAFGLAVLAILGISSWRTAKRRVRPVAGTESIKKLDEVFAEMGRLYDDKKLSAGVQGWAHEDLYQLATAFRAAILEHSPAGSHFLDDVKNCDATYSAPGTDAKLRMLAFQGIASQLRKELEAREIVRP